MGTIVELVALVKKIPESHLEEALATVKEIIDRAESEKQPTNANCPHCSSDKIVRNGRRNHKQTYLCRACGKSFAETTGSAIKNSHSSALVWKQVIADTIDGVSLDKTAESLDLHHETVFNMRHKILYRIESSLMAQPTEMAGVCQVDETYVLESIKGRKVPDDYHRKPRKHGSVAAKRGISSEYICVCTSVTGEDEKVAIAVNRATPSSEEVLEVFGNRVTPETVVLCDGNKSYGILQDRCTVATTNRINKVNGFHSFIKQRLLAARGVATVYLNRYNALFAKIYAADKSIVDDIYELMTSRSGSTHSIRHTQSVNLLNL